MPEIFRRGQTGVARGQARNAVSAIGQLDSLPVYIGVWLTGIAVAVVLIVLISVVGIFNGEQVQAGAKASSDRNGTALIGNQPIANREALAKEGYQTFTTFCQVCHQSGGYGSGGQGPALIYSGHARDSSYIHSIVRWGFAPMPAFTTDTLSNDQLYKIVVYLQYAQDNRTSKPSWVAAAPTPTPAK
jgi:mono/diheme cytochrome c family protein